MRLPRTKRTYFVLLLASIALLAAPAVMHAADGPNLIVPIPIGPNGQLEQAPSNPGDYVRIVYQWSIGIAALLAMAQLVLGGVQYVLSAGNLSSKESANERIRSAVAGLIILLSIVVILTTINPSLAFINLPELGGRLRLEGTIDSSDTTLDGLTASIRTRYNQYNTQATTDRANGAGNNGTTQAVARQNPLYRAQDELNNQGGREYCDDDLADLTAEINEYSSDPDMSEVIGPDGIFNGDNGDFAEPLSEEYQAQQDLRGAAADDRPRYQATIRCKRAAVLLGIDYARQTFDEATLRRFTSAFLKLPVRYQPRMYIEDPEKVFEGL